MPDIARCCLCDRSCARVPEATLPLYEHPSDCYDCGVSYVDEYGIPTTNSERYYESPKTLAAPEPSSYFEGLDITIYPRTDVVLAELFESHGLARLGGASTGRGWSSFRLFQRCPYAWKRRYLDKIETLLPVEPKALAEGTLIHVFLAAYYMLMVDPDYPVTPEVIRQFTLQRANPVFVQEAWRVFTAYRLHYQYEEIQPMAIEYDLVDPRTGESCRFDLLGFFPNDIPGREAGSYIIEHKSSGRFDAQTLEGWANDGEIIGQVLNYERLGLKHKYGELKGVLVNILGKQKEPQFHRTYVAPSSWQIDQHKQDLARWEALIGLATTANSFPRARGGCIDRYGMCPEWNHCATGE